MCRILAGKTYPAGRVITASTGTTGDREAVHRAIKAMTDTEKAEYDDVVRQLMAKCEQLAAENTRLRAEKSDALSVCQELYSDPTAPAALRLKAAGLALPHETPRLESVPPPIDLVAQECKPLSQLVEERRRRCDALLALPLEERAALIRGVGRDDGNGSDEH